MRFGTATVEKAQVALAAAACVGFLTVRNKNRIGAALVAGPHIKLMPPRFGRDQVRAILTSIASPPPSEHLGRSDLGGAIYRVDRLSRRRGFVCVIADFAGEEWADPLTRLGMRNDLLAIPITTPASATSHRSASCRWSTRQPGRAGRCASPERCSGAMPRLPRPRVEQQIDDLRRAGADIIELRTDSDWLGAIIRHVRRRRIQAVNAQVSGDERPIPGAAAAVAAARRRRPGGGLRRSVALASRGDGALHDRRPARRDRAATAAVAPARRCRAAVARSLGRSDRHRQTVHDDDRENVSEGRIVVALDVSLSMEATDVAPNRFAAAQEAATAFVGQVADDVEIGLVSFSGSVTAEVSPTLDRTQIGDAIAGLQLDDATAIGDALIAGTNLLVQLQGATPEGSTKTPPPTRSRSPRGRSSCSPMERRRSEQRRRKAPPTPLRLASRCSRSPSARPTA